jgi:hypothetical protein
MDKWMGLWRNLLWQLTLLVWLTGCASGVSEPTAVAPTLTLQETAVAVVATLPPAPATATPSPAPTETAVPSPTATATATPSSTPTATASPTATPTPTITPTPTATAVPILPISQLPSVSGQRVAVVGQVTAVASFSRGYRFTLSDGGGRVTLLMWDNVYDDCWDAPQINLGATVWALGEVGYFDGDLQIVPNFGGHVKVNAAPSAPPPAVEIGALGERVGQRVTVAGQIDRVAGNDNGQTLFLQDGSGEIAVFIWQNTFERIPNRGGLTAGARVRVVGPVSVFRNNLQIIPTLPYDVVLLP